MSELMPKKAKFIDFESCHDRFAPLTVAPMNFKNLCATGLEIEKKLHCLVRRVALFCTILAFVDASSQAQAAQSVTLAWDASSGPSLAGYRVHDGILSGIYTQTLDVGN